MGDLYLYSTNPMYSHELACKYLNCRHLVWCSEEYNPIGAPSSSPKRIYDSLYEECDHEDTHSSLIRGYKRTIRRLAMSWYSTGTINEDQKDEILATVNSQSWRIWRPILYIIYKPNIINAGRLIRVPAPDRAAHRDEWKIEDLDSSEFEIFER